MTATFEKIRDLFDLPERVVKNDFVVKLHDGIANEARTLDTYVPTPRIVKAFDRVLSLIRRALDDRSSQAAYLHGSFGSGKSHFLAVLDLLLDNRPAAWRLTELHELRAKHEWVGSKKLFLLPVHMVGARSLEEKIFGDYIEQVRKTHPDAPPPAIFRDEDLFRMARAAIDKQGEETFFRVLNQAASGKTGLGAALAQKRGSWTRESFEAAAGATDPAQRKRLFDALVATHYPAFVQTAGHFVEFGPGLAAIAAHAQSLDYKGVLLLLDEVILWLATLRADETRLATEVQKVSLLVETARHPRAIPIISLLARQRSLADLLGEGALGATWALIDNQLAYWKERFDEVTLEDRDFPLILQKRVLKPKSEAAKQAIDAAFADMRTKLSRDDWDELRGDFGEEEFRSLYPFSPALVQVLIDLSNVLQRERTAMRIVTDLLVSHVGDQPIGSIVPLGDLYDLLALEETKDPVLNQRFHQARTAYRAGLLPLIQKRNGTMTAERCQRLRDGHDAVQGCSGCGERACRADNRIAKTLILSAIANSVPAVRDLDARKIARLNHGVIRTPIPNGEAAQVIQRVKEWSTVAHIVIGPPKENPTVALRLEAVEIDPILKQADAFDNYGSRQGLLRRILLEELFGLTEAKDDTGSKRDHEVEWRGTRRKGQVQFANVRSLPLDDLEMPAGREWHVIVDFPFDERGKGPEDDKKRLDEFRANRTATFTMAWLPSFFSEGVLDALGKLVRVSHILERPDDYLRHLPPADRERAKGQLGDLRANLHARIVEAIEVAYGIRSVKGTSELLDEANTLTEHTVSLHGNVKPVGFARHRLDAAIDEIADALLSVAYPAHPVFGKRFTGRDATRVVEIMGKLFDAPANRADFPDRADQELLAKIAAPFPLVQMIGDVTAVLRADLLDRIVAEGRRTGIETPSVGNVVEWAAPGARMGLDPVARDLLTLVYARRIGASLWEGDRPLENATIGKIPPGAVLRTARLPGADAWKRATELAASLWGSACAGRPVTAVWLEALAREVREQAAKPGWRNAAALLSALEEKWKRFGTSGRADRLETARWVASFEARVERLAPLDLVEALAAAVPVTSGQAAGRSLATAETLLSELQRSTSFDSIDAIEQDSSPEARAILDEVASVLGSDELIQPLATRLPALARRAVNLLRARAAPPLSPSIPTAGAQATAVTAPTRPPGQPIPEPVVVSGAGAVSSSPLSAAARADALPRVAAPREGEVTIRPRELEARLGDLRTAWESALAAGDEVLVHWSRRSTATGNEGDRT